MSYCKPAGFVKRQETMKPIIRILFLCLLVQATYTQSFRQAVKGRVTDSESQRPLTGVTIQLMPGNIRTITDSLGSYYISNIPTGRYDALNSCSHGAGRKLSRFDAMKHWKTVLKEKQRKAYKEQFSELLNRSGQFSHGYIQEFDFAYKSDADILTRQPYLKKVTQTKPVVTIKYTEI